MKIAVCVKVIKGEINPFDESALECALSISDDVTVYSMGPQSVSGALLPLTRLGAKVYLISDSLYAGSDTLATSYVLSKALFDKGYDLVLCGRQSIDGDTAQVGPMLSHMLGFSLITNALNIKCDGDTVEAKTRIGHETAVLPALVTVERSYVLRFPSIFSKLGEVQILDNHILCCDAEKCGLSGSPTRVLESHESDRGKRKCNFISFKELRPLIDELIAAEEKTVNRSYSGVKLPLVWAVGEKVLSKAKEIADEVMLIDETDPAEVVKKALSEKPPVILWNADMHGRKNAPIAAAMLRTGLCADCTSLETDGKTLFMYRPASGGNVIAKIKCNTYPQMATVRTEMPANDIIVSGGRGVAEGMDKLESFARELGAQLGASRGLVDMGKADYDLQIGLTGKMVSPKIYIAVGISGAVHHTCAIENAKTVIAINPDKNARIFEYADYGIIDRL